MKAISANDLVITEVLDEGWLMGIDTPNNGREIAITKELALGIIRLQQGTNPPTGHDHTHEFNIDSIRYVKDPILGGHTIPVKRCACGVTRKLSELSPAGHDHTGQEELRDNVTGIIYGADWRERDVADAFKPDVEAVMKLIEAEASRREQELLGKVLDELKEVIKNYSFREEDDATTVATNVLETFVSEWEKELKAQGEQPTDQEPCDYCKMKGREWTPSCEDNKQ